MNALSILPVSAPAPVNLLGLQAQVYREARAALPGGDLPHWT